MRIAWPGYTPHGTNELGLLRRCGSALAEVLQGRADPLGLLFSDEGPSAVDLYREAPAARAANRMLGEIVAAAVSGLSHEGRLRALLQGLPGETPLRVVVHLMGPGGSGARKSSTKTSPQVQLESG